MFYMFWPDEDLDNEWPDHFVVSYDKELEKIPFVYLIVFTCLVIDTLVIYTIFGIFIFLALH